jgi:8-oxo-dGTP diphosphatase
MPSERFHLVSATHLLLFNKEGKILLSKRQNTGYEDGNWSVVAGHLDGGEFAREAMAREACEEAGIEIRPEDLRVVHVMHRIKDDERIDFFMTAKNFNGTPRIMEPHKCSEIAWFSVDKLPANTIPYIRKAIGECGKSAFYSEFRE